MLFLALASNVPACTAEEEAGPYVDPDIETFPAEASRQVPVGTPTVYNTDPPTSGMQYPVPQAGGFYTNNIAAGFLVHSLERGGVVVYYDANYVAPADLDRLRDLAAEHPGDSAQVVVVPRSDATFPIILTAWTHRLRLTLYDPGRVEGFLALFLGQGPEHS